MNRLFIQSLIQIRDRRLFILTHACNNVVACAYFATVLVLLTMVWSGGVICAAEPPNGGFEDGLVGWPQTLAGAALATDAHTGARALCLTGSSDRPVQVNSAVFNVTANATYKLSAYVKQVRGDGPYQVTVAWMTAQEKVIKYDNDWAGQDAPRIYAPHGTSFVAPAQAARCSILLGVWQGVECLFDGVSLTLTAPPPQNRFTAVWLDAAGKIIRTDDTERFGPSDLLPPGAMNIPDRSVKIIKAASQKDEYGPWDVTELQYYTLNVSSGNTRGERADLFSPRGAKKLCLRPETGSTIAPADIALWLSSALYPSAEKRPFHIWMCPDFRVDPNPLFAPNAPWVEARRALSVFKLHSRVLALEDRHASWTRPWTLDVQKMVRFLRETGKPLALEMGGLYGDCGPEFGMNSADRELALIDRVYAAGGKVSSIGLDDPISRILKGGRKSGQGGAHGNPQLSLSETIHHLIVYFKRVHAKYPEIKIGLISNAVWWDFDGHRSYFGAGSWSADSGYKLNQVLDQLLKALDAAGEKLAFVQIDTPYDYFTAVHSPLVPEPLDGARKILAIEKYCRAKGLRFGLMYNSEARRTQSEAQYAEETLKMLQLYRAAGGQPDDLLIESWYDFTKTLLPETDPSSLTRLVVDFAHALPHNKMLPKQKQGAEESAP